MKLKKVLAAALAGTMVMASLTAVSAETMEDQSISDFMQNMTEGTAPGIDVSGDFDVTLTFHNNGNRDQAGNYYTNFVICIRDENSNDMFVRADNWSWIYDYETAITYYCDNTVSDGTTIDWYTHTDYDGDWAAWVDAMSAANDGCDCTVSITRSGNLITVVSECGGATFTIAADTDIIGENATIYLTGEQCKLTNIEYTVGGASSTSDDSTSDDSSSDDTASDDSTSDDSASTTTDDSTTTTDSSNDSTTQTGDAAPIAAVAVALLGCAAIAYASKKRFA